MLDSFGTGVDLWATCGRFAFTHESLDVYFQAGILLAIETQIFALLKRLEEAKTLGVSNLLVKGDPIAVLSEVA